MCFATYTKGKVAWGEVCATNNNELYRWNSVHGQLLTSAAVIGNGGPTSVKPMDYFEDTYRREEPAVVRKVPTGQRGF